MHSFESGILNHVISILLHPLPGNDVKKIDKCVETLWSNGGGNRSSFARLFPRVSFNRGFCSLTLLSSSERVGQLFVVALLMNTTSGRTLFANRFANDFDERRELRSSSAPNHCKRQRLCESFGQQHEVSVREGSSVSPSDEEESDSDSSNPNSPVQAAARKIYTWGEQRIILRQLQLLETVEQMQRVVPALHWQQTKLVLDRFMVQTNVFDKLLLLGQREQSAGIFGDTPPDYHNPADGFGPPSSHDGTFEWPQHICELLLTNELQNNVDIASGREDCTIALDMDQFLELVELMLSFHSFLKYGADMLHSDLVANICAYQTNFQRMMTLLTKGLKRVDNSRQFKIQKFVECNHFLMEHLFKGPPASFNTDTGERGLKKWAKLPATTAQNRGDQTFRQQVSQNSHQAYLLGLASSSSPLHHQPQQMTLGSDENPELQAAVAYGKTYVYLFKGEMWGFFLQKDVSKPNLKESEQVVFPKPLSRWFNQQLGRWYNRQLELDPEYQLVIPIYTELVLPFNGQEHPARLRAHPNYRGGGPWYDCAMINYEYEDEFQGSFPARCACFFQLPETVPRDLIRMSVSFQHTQEILALVQESEYQTDAQKQFSSRICAKHTLQSFQTTSHGVRYAKLSCVTHTCFVGGIYAFDGDLGSSSPSGDPFTKMPVRNAAPGRTSSFDIVVVKDRRLVWARSFLCPP
jgi:hypothetical protein